MSIKFTNNASATLAASISSSSTSITVTTGQGSLFPALATGDYFYAALVDSSNNIEYVKVTARTGDTMTAVRAQEGTPARAYLASDKFVLRVTAAALTDIQASTLQAAYPVGSIYMNAASSANPATIFGFGLWSPIAAGRVLLGVGSNDGQTFSNGVTGGAYAPSLLAHSHAGSSGTVSNSHSHGFSGSTSTAGAHDHGLLDQNGRATGVTAYQGGQFYAATGGNSANVAYRTDIQGNHSHTFSGQTGTEDTSHTHPITITDTSSGSQTVGNMQPYLAVYMWQRTA